MEQPFLHRIPPPEQLLSRQNSSWIDWITMFLLIGNTANPFFYQSVEMLFASFMVLLVLWFLKEGTDTRLNKLFWIYVIVLTFLQVSQTLVYHFFPLKTFLGEYLRIAFAVTALRILGKDFFDRFVKFVDMDMVEFMFPIQIGTSPALQLAATRPSVPIWMIKRQIQEMVDREPPPDPNITAAFALARAQNLEGLLRMEKENAQLRDQFNAARLKYSQA